MNIGANILALRDQVGMSQAELASLLGVSDKTVSSWENETRTPRMGVVKKLSDYFGVPVASLLGCGGEAEEAEHSEREVEFSIRVTPGRKFEVIAAAVEEIMQAYPGAKVRVEMTV